MERGKGSGSRFSELVLVDTEEDLEVDLFFLADLVDLLACDEVVFVIEVFKVLVVDVDVLVEDVLMEVVWWLVEVDDFEDEVFSEDVFVVLLTEEVVEIEAGHNRCV